MIVLVTGGTGYIGSHTAVEILRAGHDVIMADNLSNSREITSEIVQHLSGRTAKFQRVNFTEAHAVDSLFRAFPMIDAVIHFAALKSAPESVGKPLEYYDQNLRMTLNLLKAMKQFDVHNLIFSSSASVYGASPDVPFKEDGATPAPHPYAWSKLMSERIIQDACTADQRLRAISLRYFNPVGAHPSGLLGDNPFGIPLNISPIITRVARGELDVFRVTGNDFPTPDGTGIRDYIHVTDLAFGHIAALNRLSAPEFHGFDVFNLGSGKGYSVLEVLHAFERAVGSPIPFELAPRRPGDPAVSLADISKASRILNFSPSLSLDQMCTDSWRFAQKAERGREGSF
jgi:UDP-glucose 4-epimerase